MIWTNPDELMSKNTHTYRHTDTAKCHCGDYVLLNASRLDKKDLTLSQTSPGFYVSAVQVF